MDGIIITGILGFISTIVSGWTSWFFARKKYNTEVDSNLIANMQQSLEFYQKLSDDNSRRLEEALTRSAALELEVKELRTQVFDIMTKICFNLECKLRVTERNEVSIEENSKEK